MHLHRTALGPVLLDDLPLGLARGDPENPDGMRVDSLGCWSTPRAGWRIIWLVVTGTCWWLK